MGANFTRRVITIGLIGTSLAAAAPAGAVVADKNQTVREAYAAKLSNEVRASQPRMTPPNVERTLRSDANPNRSPAPVGEITSNGSGFSWTDAALGAGTTLVLLAMAGGIVLLGMRRRPITG